MTRDRWRRETGEESVGCPSRGGKKANSAHVPLRKYFKVQKRDDQRLGRDFLRWWSHLLQDSGWDDDARTDSGPVAPGSHGILASDAARRFEKGAFRRRARGGDRRLHFGILAFVVLIHLAYYLHLLNDQTQQIVLLVQLRLHVAQPESIGRSCGVQRKRQALSAVKKRHGI